jgi:hypothetical protein
LSAGGVGRAQKTKKSAREEQDSQKFVKNLLRRARCANNRSGRKGHSQTGVAELEALAASSRRRRATRFWQARFALLAANPVWQSDFNSGLKPDRAVCNYGDNDQRDRRHSD